MSVQDEMQHMASSQQNERHFKEQLKINKRMYIVSLVTAAAALFTAITSLVVTFTSEQTLQVQISPQALSQQQEPSQQQLKNQLNGQ